MSIVEPEYGCDPNGFDENAKVEDFGDGKTVAMLFYSPFGYKDAIKKPNARSFVSVEGAMDCRAMCRKTASMKQAIEYLKVTPETNDLDYVFVQNDILKSLKIRLELRQEDLEEEAESDTFAEERTVNLQRRLFTDWKVRNRTRLSKTHFQFNAQICDYLPHRESKEQIIYGISDVLGVDVDYVNHLSILKARILF